MGALCLGIRCQITPPGTSNNQTKQDGAPADPKVLADQAGVAGLKGKVELPGLGQFHWPRTALIEGKMFPNGMQEGTAQGEGAE